MNALPVATETTGPGEIWCDRYRMPVGRERCVQSVGRPGCGHCPDGQARRRAALNLNAPIERSVSHLKICPVPGCDHHANSGKFCSMHWHRWRALGRPTNWADHPAMLAPPHGFEKKSCRIPGCDRAGYSQDYCRIHYWRWVRAGRPETWSGGDTEVCRVPGCEQTEFSRGYCRPHYLKRWHRGQLENRTGETEAR